MPREYTGVRRVTRQNPATRATAPARATAGAPAEHDFVIRDFHFTSGEMLPELHGRAIVIPFSGKTAGHGTHTLAAVWKKYLAQLLQESER
jgi:hypothetical protein